jgi:hypothetical protein
MRRMIVVLGLVASACGSEPAARQAEPAANQSQTAQAMQQQILALAEPQRLALFANAIRDSGHDCQQVNSAASGGTYRGLPVWRATCRGGGIWTIVIAENGGAQVLDARQVELVTDASENEAQ